MFGINYLAVAVAAVAGFIEGALWYSPLLFGAQWATLRGLDPSALGGTRPALWEIVAEILRCLVVALVLSGFIARLDVTSMKGAVLLALALWLGFQAMQTLGGVLHEGYPLQLYAIHVSDALVKIVLMSVILVAWR